MAGNNIGNLSCIYCEDDKLNFDMVLYVDTPLFS